uniref:Uncharacterized protein n=1 Tax=Solanum lycopersicum TaxID=4081 RepID=A0A3Q7GSI2_SOLLC
MIEFIEKMIVGVGECNKRVHLLIY